MKAPAAPVVEQARLVRALTERFYCLAGAIEVGDTHPAGTFQVLSGTRGNIYQVRLSCLCLFVTVIQS
jgi:hypothetical protein